MRRAVFAAALSLCASPAAASDAGSLGLSAGGMLLLTLGGGVVTSILQGQALADDQKVHPAVRNMGFAFGGVNTALGTAGLIAAGFIDDDDVQLAIYISAGTITALGLTGLGLSWATEPFPETQLSVAPTPGGGLAVLQGRF